MLIECCKVKVTHPAHGLFVAESDVVEKYMERLLGDVNYKRLAVAAYVSANLDLNYFDCDILTLCIVMASLSFDLDALTDWLCEDDGEFSEIYNRFLPFV